MLQSDQSVFVIIDIQGRLASLMYEKDRLYDNVVRMTKASRLLDIPILWNEQLPDKLGQTVPEISSALSGLKPLVKNTFSCCDNPNFMQQLEATGRRQVLLAGIETHICVYQSALQFIERGYGVHLLIDAVSSRFQHNYELGIQRIKDAGGVLTSVEMALFEMFKVAEGDQFRQMVKILK